MARRTTDRVAKSWGHPQELLFEDCYDPAIDRYRSPYAMRGLGDRGHLPTLTLMIDGEFAGAR